MGLLIQLAVATMPLYVSVVPLHTNVLVYNEGDTQVSSSISAYDEVVAGQPIEGSIFVTHNSNDPVDINSFRLGDKPLRVEFVQSALMSSTGPLEVSVYSFKLDGMSAGSHQLPPVIVKVGNKEYHAPTMSVEVAPAEQKGF